MPRRYKTVVMRESKERSFLKASKDNSNIESDRESNDEDDQDGEDTVVLQPKTKVDEYSREVLTTTQHYTHPALNIGMGLPGNGTQQMFPSCSMSMALPLFVSERRTPTEEICTIRSTACEEWERTTNLHWTRYKKRPKYKKKYHYKHVHDESVYDMAEHIAIQENPYFREKYDYHYTGGNFNLMSFEKGSTSTTLAMHTTGDQLQQLNFSKLHANSDQLQPIHSKTLDTLSSEIFQVTPMRSFRVNHGNTFMVRSLNEISIYELTLDDDEYELRCESKFSSQEGPFISAVQITNCAKSLAIACQDRTVRIVDMITNEDISSHDVCIVKGLQQSCSNWAQLLPIEGSCFYYANQSVLLTIDTRCVGDAINPCFASSAYSKQCESFSCLAPSVNPNLLYVASNHKLHCLDMRYLGKRLTDRAVVTWTHQMMAPPLYMDTCTHDNKEYIALGSLLAKDQRLCEITNPLAENIENMSSLTLPYSPPQLEEGLANARMHGHVDVYADLGTRIKSCITGLKFQTFDKAVDGAFAQLLTTNSLGDVFGQRMSERDEKESRRELRTGLHTIHAIKYYANKVRSTVKNNTLHCTDIHNMVRMRHIMKSQREVQQEEEIEPERIKIEYGMEESDSDDNDDDDVIDEVTHNDDMCLELEAESEEPKEDHKMKKDEDKQSIDNVAKKLPISRGPWQKSAYDMSKYTDVITKKLLEIWDVENEYDMTRDVNINMIDEKLRQDNPEPLTSRTDLWLSQLPDEPPEKDEKDPPLVVPGTNLSCYYEAQDAEYFPMPVIETMHADDNDHVDDRRDIKPNTDNNDMEFQNEYETTKPPPPKKTKAKSKYQKGF